MQSSWCEKICNKLAPRLFVVLVRWITEVMRNDIYFLFTKHIKIVLTLVWGNFEHWAIWSLHEFSWTFTPQSGTNNATLLLRCAQTLHLITEWVRIPGAEILRTRLAGFGLSIDWRTMSDSWNLELFLLPMTSLQKSEMSLSFWPFDSWVTDFDLVTFFLQ